MAYMSWNNPMKLHTTPIENESTLYVDLTAIYDDTNRSILFSSIRNRLRISESTECLNLMEELYRFTRFYKYGEDTDTGTSAWVQQGGNERPSLFHLFLDYTQCIYRHIYEEMGRDHLSNPSIYETNLRTENNNPAFPSDNNAPVMTTGTMPMTHVFIVAKRSIVNRKWTSSTNC